MAIINIILMLIAVCVAVQFAYRNPATLPVVLLILGPFRFGLETGEGMNLSAIWLAVAIACTVLALLRMPGPRVRLSVVEGAYAIFILYALFSAFRSPDLGYGARMFLKLLFPFLVLLTARRAAQSGRMPEMRRAFGWVLTASFVAFLLVGGPTQRLAPLICGTAGNVLWAAAAFADHMAVMGVAALAFWRIYGDRRYLGYAALAAISPVFVDIRTGIAAFAVGASVLVLAAFRKAIAVPVLLVLYLAVGAALMLVPNVRDHMFHKGVEVDTAEAMRNPGSVSMDSVNDSGRFMLWQKSMEALYDPSPLIGSGVGAVQHFMYTQTFTELKVVHSSYVELLCDLGLVGLVVYLCVCLLCIWEAWRAWRRSLEPAVRATALAAIGGCCAILVCMGFDNVINYTLVAGQLPMAFVGLAAGLAARAPANARPVLRTLHALPWRAG